MLRLAYNVNEWQKISNLEYSKKFDLTGFGWEYKGNVESLEVSLSINAGGAWNKKFGIMVQEANGIIIGYSKRRKRKFSKELTEFCTKVDDEYRKKESSTKGEERRKIEQNRQKGVEQARKYLTSRS